MTDGTTSTLPTHEPTHEPTLLPTPSQTVGPFFSHALGWSDGPYVVAAEHPDAIELTGQVFDGAGELVPDALIETWQADPAGRFAHPEDGRGSDSGEAHAGFRGFGRCPTDADGRYRIVTVRPGVVPAADGTSQAPHINVSVFARGLLDRVVTRVYFPDEAEANAEDPVLVALPDDTARAGLVAVWDAGADSGVLRFDIHLQGEHETAFFEV